MRERGNLTDSSQIHMLINAPADTEFEPVLGLQWIENVFNLAVSLNIQSGRCPAEGIDFSAYSRFRTDSSKHPQFHANWNSRNSKKSPPGRAHELQASKLEMAASTCRWHPALRLTQQASRADLTQVEEKGQVTHTPALSVRDSLGSTAPTLGVWCPLVGLEAMELEAIAETCLKHFNLVILSNVRKPAHPWLAPDVFSTLDP